MGYWTNKGYLFDDFDFEAASKYISAIRIDNANDSKAMTEYYKGITSKEQMALAHYFIKVIGIGATYYDMIDYVDNPMYREHPEYREYNDNSRGKPVDGFEYIEIALCGSEVTSDVCE